MVESDTAVRNTVAEKTSAHLPEEKMIVAPLPRPNLVSLMLEIMIGCNLKCALCNVDKLKHRFLSVEKIEEIINKLPTLQRIVILGHGEPLLHPEWLKIMEVIKRFQLKMHMVTNGMLWTDEKIMALPPQTIVQFSIDSFRHDIYAAMRPRGDLVRVLGNLKRLAELRSDVIIGIQSLITKQTELYLEEIGSFCRQFGFDFNVIYPGTTKETYKEFYPERPHYLKNYTAPKGCAEPFTSVVVGIDGEIYPCCYMYGSLNKEKPGDKHIEEMVEGKINCVNAGEYRLGNIYVDDVYKIWNDKTMRSVRNAIYYSQNPTATYQELRNSTDLENGHGYCAMCALRWGKLC